MPATKHTPFTWRRTLAAAAAVLACQAPTAQADTLDRLRALLEATPVGGWVDASIGTFSSAWPTGADAVNVANSSGPARVVKAWSSFAWDSQRDQIILWGGGHGNYPGNEVYTWSANTGNWSLASLPSRIDAQGFVVDSAAPQSSHTYDNNLYLAVNDRFITFGGAAWPSGGVYQVKNADGTVTRSGPWLWDPSKASSTLVGGTNGSGWDATDAGGNMWTNRQGQWTGTEVSGFQSGAYIYGATAYRTEAGKDVVYMSVDPYQQGAPGLYRYTVGNLAAGELDTWEKVGITDSTTIYGSAGTLDNANNLFLRPAQRRVGGSLITELSVWDLTGAAANHLASDTAVSLTVAGSGASLSFIEGMALEYDSLSGDLYLFTGLGDGNIYRTHAAFNADGSLDTSWELQLLTPATATFPQLTYLTGMYGKVHYVEDLQAFMVLGDYDNATGDAKVWLYKADAITAAVPEPSAWLLLMAGGAGLAAWRRRRAA